jgi:hypothetical protein
MTPPPHRSQEQKDRGHLDQRPSDNDDPKPLPSPAASEPQPPSVTAWLWFIAACIALIDLVALLGHIFDGS